MSKRTLMLLICMCLLQAICSASTVSIVDYTGNTVSVEAPVHRVVSLGTGVAEYIYALDGGQCLVGRDSYSHFPPEIQNVPVAGKSSYSPDLETIMKLQPDLVIADSMISDEDKKEMEDAGIPVIIDSISDPSRDVGVMENLGKVLGKSDRAKELIDFITEYKDLVEERTANLAPEDRPKVFFEWAGTPYYTIANGTSSDTLIGYAGGINIAKDLGNETHSYITVSPEWVVETDPDVIIQTQSSEEPYTEDQLKGFRDEILSRPELQNVKAIKSGKVYLVSGEVRYGVRSIISELYMAKWLHPDLFEDLDPEAVQKEMTEKFYGVDLNESYVYPVDVQS